MSRLIDADALIYEDVECVDGNTYMVVHAPQIENTPTVYDLDKVIELIETKILGKVCVGCGYLRNNICTYKGSNCGVSKPMYDDIKKVFEEVKGGGVNE